MDVRETLLSIYRTASDRDVSFLAAAVAYYAFVSVIPLVLLALVVGSLVDGEAAAERLVLVAGDLLPEAGEDLVAEALTTEAGRAQATVVAIGVATWGALKVFRGLSLAFDKVYDEVVETSLLEQLVDGIVVIIAGTGAMALMVVVGTILGFAADVVPFAGLLSWVTLLIGLVFVFLPIYYVLPPIPVTIPEVLPGAVFAAVGWTILQIGFQFYAANAGQYQAYGAVGAVLLFVTWLYFAGLLVLFGAVLNVVLADQPLAE
ncbi:YihY/virulence factor BrkB family protein [Natronolimnohabitans sp. A-GB9]|uniref:YihY/virulence factor BrkB family protein n=1 Tax=Natronolimnohabitans sp. A-GB9 TaxID=3069757 RepID=UPI0027B6A54B|nr:YihY/virulence factor BrkB family protein [Natronolimnohabitans sp. A-GB9]MDQ2051355.1 YihY/virulence factor BrkB family protein [Natronolimnohabitans sp. A-GB9]